MLQNGIETDLRERLTAAAELELESLVTLVQDFQPTDAEDRRLMRNGQPFSARQAYDALHSHLADDTALPVWTSKVPSRVRVFGWLLHLDRINTRKNLANKTTLPDAYCPRCSTIDEDRTHLFFECPAAQQVWAAMHMPPLSFDMPDL